MLQIESRGLIYDASARPANERIAFFPGLCCLTSGAILSAFYVGSRKHSPDGTIRLCRSDDSGETWNLVAVDFETEFEGTPGSLAGPELIEAEPGRLLMLATWFDRSDPERPLFDPETEGILRSKQLMAVSENEGLCWSEWQVVETGELSGCATTGPMIALPDGTIAHAFESFKEFDDPSPPSHAAWLVASRDGGRSWSDPMPVASDPDGQRYYWDQRLATSELNGDLAAMFWTHDRNRKCDLPVHFRLGRWTAAGPVWEPIRETPIEGQIAAPLWLSKDTLAALVVHRHGPSEMRLWVSWNRGGSWDVNDSQLIYSHDEQAQLSQTAANVDFASYWEDMGKWSFGHPAVRRLDSERLLLSYYAGAPEAMSVHSVRVRCSEDH